MAKPSAEAVAAFERYVATEAERLDEFRRIVESRGGPGVATLDLTRESLRPLGAWLLDPTPPGPEDANRPLWAFDRADDDPYLVGSWLPDGIGAYLVAMHRARHQHVTWKLEDDARSIHFQQPVVVGLHELESQPYTLGLAYLGRARNASPPDPDWLVKVFDMHAESAAKMAAVQRPPTDDDLDRDLEDIAVEAIEGDNDWNAELSMSDAAETVLGRSAFDGLYDRFSAIPGVERIEWEDRERFLLRLARGTDLAVVRDAARAAINAARASKEIRGSAIAQPYSSPSYS